MSNEFIGDYKSLGTYTNCKDALALLQKIATAVQPIMKKYSWRVGLLREFWPSDPRLLGLNVNHGEEICIRLRPAHNVNIFFEFDDLIGTMLHELTHIVNGPHDAAFYNMLDKLNAEYDELLVKGYIGFSGKGYQLGQAVSHHVPIEVAQKMALEEAERRRIMNLMTKGGRKLGGDTTWNGLSLRERAALAAERRRRDAIWCGSEAATTWTEWKCRQCTLFNKPLALQCEVCLVERPNDEGNSVTALVPNPESSYHSTPHRPQESWTCHRCTLKNDGDVIMCLGCDYLREAMIS